jgi:hypothetical protein
VAIWPVILALLVLVLVLLAVGVALTGRPTFDKAGRRRT